MLVHKFGGTSLADANCFLNVYNIVKHSSTSTPQVIVVSAMAGVTNLLQLCLDEAKAQKLKNVPVHLEKIREKHKDLILQLGLDSETYQSFVDEEITQVATALETVAATKSVPEQIFDFVMGRGEILSSKLLTALFQKKGNDTRWIDARELLVVDEHKQPLADECQARVDKAKINKTELCIATGYIASTLDGIMTTLGRNGSDYSASLFARFLRAEELIIWTDVAGVYNADPRKVPQAQVIKHLSYSEAMEMAFFGAKVLHPRTMGPAIQAKIPILIKSSLAPEAPGTLISLNSSIEEGHKNVVKGFSIGDNISLINIEGSGMIGVPGTSEKLFGSLARAQISVVAISQASSEHSICIAVNGSDADKAENVIRQAFNYELSHQQIQDVEVIPDCALLAAVGDGMAKTKGVASHLMGALAKAGVNIKAIAQGSSERNITIVIKSYDAQKALNAAHAAFNLSEQTFSVGLIGPGLIGGNLLDQLRDQIGTLKKNYNLDIRLRGLVSSKKMYLAEEQVDLSNWQTLWKQEAQPVDFEAFVDHIKSPYYPHTVLIDCTASDSIASRYDQWMKHGIHIITPNKKAGSGNQKYYDTLRSNTKKYGSEYLYETTVGAGLPIIKSLRDLLQTGDKIEKIEGVFSGTLSYLFNSFDPSQSFSENVKKAKEQGFTEPDPRDDLSGTDVARKVLILAREVGLKLELSDVEIDSLYPKELDAIKDPEKFLVEYQKFDNSMAAKAKAAQQRGCVLRYAGSVDIKNKKVTAKLVEFSTDHPFAGLKGSDNIISFTTQYYKAQPLIIRGPGAGPAVTAAGVFADLLRLSYRLGSPL